MTVAPRGLKPFELALHVGGLQVPDQPAGLGVAALHPVMGPHGRLVAQLGLA
jgi:hypothetical protein